MMMTLFDHEQIMKNHDASIRREEREKATKKANEQAIANIVTIYKQVDGSMDAAIQNVMTMYGYSEEDATAIENYRVLVGGLVGQNVSDSAILDNSTATVSFDVEAKYASKVYVGGVAGQNGARDGSRALITNCTYKLPTDATNKLSVLNHTALGSVAANVIGNDLAHQSGVKTDEHTFTIDYYKFVEETLELDKTETINVAAITE